MKKWTITLMPTLCFALSCWANGESGDGTYPGSTSQTKPALGYIVSVPTAGTQDFIGNASFRGIGFETTRMLQENFGLGFSLRWVYLSESLQNVTSTVDNLTVTANQYRSIDAVPILIHARYEFGGKEKGFRPYVVLGVGALYGIRQFLVGTFDFSKYGWQFEVAPELGAYFPPFRGGDSRMFFSARYDAGVGSDAIPAISFLSFQIGLTFGV